MLLFTHAAVIHVKGKAGEHGGAAVCQIIVILGNVLGCGAVFISDFLRDGIGHFIAVIIHQLPIGLVYRKCGEGKLGFVILGGKQTFHQTVVFDNAVSDHKGITLGHAAEHARANDRFGGGGLQGTLQDDLMRKRGRFRLCAERGGRKQRKSHRGKQHDRK